MQPDRKQSFIQWLNEPTGWLSSDLALDCRVSLGGMALHSSSQPLAEERYWGEAGRMPLLQEPAQLDKSRAMCVQGQLVFCWPSVVLMETSKQSQGCSPSASRELAQLRQAEMKTAG